ncbi:hypothetical protein [Ornithinimicrobium sufpigmenti]|uniref:hypothetical protein n=1 Tax=Ornithinimicrobium sufpigmenti TaxID=2508882 RepID=UPI001035EA3B|nr:MULTISPECIES: hypothetical protein [unclassified Ornithinimicrobium]
MSSPTVKGSGRSWELVQGLLIALAAVLAGVALVMGDITVPQSAVGGGALVLAGICWAAAAVLKARSGR